MKKNVPHPLLFLVTLLLLCLEGITQYSKTMIDSLKSEDQGIIKLAQKDYLKIKVWDRYTFIDPAGNLFALSYDSAKVYILKDGHLENIQSNVTRRFDNLAMSPDGSLYGRVMGDIYKYVKDVWVNIFKTPSLPYSRGSYFEDFTVGLDERIYASNSGQVIRLEANGWDTLGKSSMKNISISFGRFFKKVIDSKGMVYVVGEFENTGNEINRTIGCWNGKEWIKIGTMPGKVYDFNIDKNDVVYASGYADKIPFYMKWKGGIWINQELPPEIKNEGTLFHDQNGNLFLHGNNRANSNYVLYQLKNDQWEYLLQYPWKESNDKDFPVGAGKMYCIDNRLLHEFRMNGK